MYGKHEVYNHQAQREPPEDNTPPPPTNERLCNCRNWKNTECPLNGELCEAFPFLENASQRAWFMKLP